MIHKLTLTYMESKLSIGSEWLHDNWLPMLQGHPEASWLSFLHLLDLLILLYDIRLEFPWLDLVSAIIMIDRQLTSLALFGLPVSLKCMCETYRIHQIFSIEAKMLGLQLQHVLLVFLFHSLIIEQLFIFPKGIKLLFHSEVLNLTNLRIHHLAIT